MVKLREEIEEWRSLIGKTQQEMEALKAQLTEQMAENPEKLVERQEIKQQIAELRETIAEMKANPPAPIIPKEPLAEPKPPKSGEEENHTQETQTATSSDQTEAPQTRATKRGWI